jgi:acetylornithine/succinyldiaminopimelate/putrescine aminotransferase
MMLARFYRLDKTYAEPEYAGRIPVFLVIADNVGGKEANYHGTTIFTQMMRGMWPDFYQILDEKGLFKVVPVKINDTKYFENVVVKYDEGKYKIAGFFHEIILMNYGGIVLTKDYLKQVYRICKNRDIPVLVDEIQSCIWSPELFMFKEYDLKPDFVSIGKGFPGGQYPASKILTTAKMDNLNLFGALVTNGQEELASMAYLITIAFVEENKKYIKALGSYYEQEIRNMEREFNHIITKVEGVKHMTTIFFENAEKAVEFSTYLSSRGIDISTQAYKADGPPSALTKLPLIATPKMVDFIIQTMREALNKFQNIEINDMAV